MTASAADRQRRYRARCRRDARVLRVEAQYYQLIECLLQTGRITERQALQHEQVEHAVGVIVEQWVEEITKRYA